MCQNCHQHFSAKQKCQIHQSKCLQGKTCVHCNAHFRSLREFAQHKCEIKCKHCNKSFSKSSNKQSHEGKCQGHSIQCKKCKKTFQSQKGLGKHVCKSNKSQSFNCNKCTKTFSDIALFKKHQCIQQLRCRRCSAQFHNRHDLYIHIREEHNQRGRGNQVTPDIDDPKVRQCYTKYKSFIHDQSEIGQNQSFYNFPLDHDFSLDDIERHTNYIYRNEAHSFKLNMSFGFIPVHGT